VNSHFKGVVWPRTPLVVNDKVRYRYVVVGVLTTDQPVDFLDKQEILLDGHAFGLPDALSAIRQRAPLVKPGNTASEVLAHLKRL
jgi:hypothetical protein